MVPKIRSLVTENMTAGAAPALRLECKLTDVSIKMRSPLLLLLIIVLFVMSLIIANRVFFYVLYVLVLALLGAYFWTRMNAEHVTLGRELRTDWAQVGDKMRERFALANDSRLPLLWAEIEDHSDLPGYQASRVETAASKTRVKWDATAICQRRGLFTIGPVILRTGDPFGLFIARRDYTATRSFLVYPSIVDLPGIRLPKGQIAGTARTALRTQEVTTNASSIRYYLPGDALNRIHWLSTARMDDLMVKEFDLEPSGNLWIIMDMDAAVQAGDVDESTVEYAVKLASSLAYKTLAENKSVGLITYGKYPAIIQPDKGLRQLRRILQVLAMAQAADDYPLTRVLDEALPNVGRGMTVAVITPSADTRWMTSLLAMVRYGLAPAAILLDAASFGGQSNTAALLGQLANLGITAYVITKGQEFSTITALKPQEGPTVRVLSTGRVILAEPQQSKASPAVVSS